MSRIYHIKQLTPAQTAEIAAQIDEGAVVVFPTDTVYGIGTNAFNEDAISRIYAIKNRPAHAALQILVSSKNQAQNITCWSAEADKLADAFWPGGLTLILPANETGKPLLRGFKGLGLRMPDYPSLCALLQQMKYPLVSTSANLHGESDFTQEEKILEFFDGKADLILLGGDLSCISSSVVDLTQGVKLLREGSVQGKMLEKILGFGVQ